MPALTFDCHTHATGFSFWNLGHGRFPTTQSARDLADKTERLGIDHAACFVAAESFYFDPRHLLRGEMVPGGPENYPYELLNRQHLRECAWFGRRRLLPFLSVDPLREPAAQLEMIARAAPAVFGLKVHTLTTASSPADAVTAGFLDLAAELDLPVLFHTGRRPAHCHPSLVVETASARPDVRISIAHLGSFLPEVIEAVVQLPNLFTDCSPLLANIDEALREDWNDVQYVDLSDPVSVLEELAALLPGSLLWGSDEPWTAVAGPRGEPWSMHDYADEVAVLRASRQEVQVDIASRAPLRWLFGDRTEAEALAVLHRRLDALGEVAGAL